MSATQFKFFCIKYQYSVWLLNIKLCHTTLLLYTRIILDLTFTSHSNLLINIHVHIPLSWLYYRTLVSLSLILRCFTVQIWIWILIYNRHHSLSTLWHRKRNFFCFIYCLFFWTMRKYSLIFSCRPKYSIYTSEIIKIITAFNLSL